MKSRSFLPDLYVSAAIIAATQLISGCKTLVNDPTPGDFAQIRAINFATCSSPMDIYLEGEGQPLDTLPTAAGLNFGLACVYRTNLPASASGTMYHVIARPVNNKTAEIAHADVMVKPGEQWTVAIYHDQSNSTFPTDVIKDPNTNAGVGVSDKVFVRFLNASDEHPTLNIHVNNNYDSKTAAPNPLKFREVSDYLALDFKTDTTYTFMAVDPATPDSVLSRISGVSFDPGSYHTICFTGDPCKVGSNGVPAGDALDSNRIRLFFDYSPGTDQTSPTIPQSMRYNFVNALIPADNPNEAKERYYTELGIVINNDNNFTFAHMKPLSVAPNMPFDLDGSQPSVHQTMFTSTPLTAAVDVKAFRTDNVADGVRGLPLFDYKAGKRADIISDIPVSLMVIDTPLALSKAADSTQVVEVAVPIPDAAIANMARIVLVNGLAPTHLGTSPVLSYVSYSVNGTPDAQFVAKKPTTYDNTLIVGPGTVNIDAVMNPKNGGSGAPTATVSTSFNAKAGKIYEVIVCGQRGSANYPPQFIVVETNPTAENP